MKTLYLLNMENQPKAYTRCTSTAPPSSDVSVSILQNLVRMLYPLVMFLFFLSLVLIFLILTFLLLFERAIFLILLILCLIVSYSHLLSSYSAFISYVNSYLVFKFISEPLSIRTLFFFLKESKQLVVDECIM